MKNMKNFNNTPNKSYICDTPDGYITVWESRSPALVGVIIANYKNEDYVLIGERGKGAADNIGKWNVPCGYLDWDEDGTEGVCREIYEETGLYVPDILKNGNIIKNHMEQPFFVNTDPKENRQNTSLSYGLYFSCDELPELTNKYSEPNEVGELVWLKTSEIDNMKFAFEHDKRIKMFLKLL